MNLPSQKQYVLTNKKASYVSGYLIGKNMADCDQE